MAAPRVAISRCAPLRSVRPKPPLWWVGGKRRLIRQFGPLLPKKPWDLYIEPFFGGGAVFFHLVSSLLFHRGPTGAILIDKNEELINFYRVVRDNLEELLADLRKHEITAEYFYRMRALNSKKLTPVQRASRFLYLSKTGYRGMWRVDREGQYNVRFGWQKNPKDIERLIDEPNLRLVSRALARPGVYLLHGDYRLSLFWAGPGTFIYLDPPYYPLQAARNTFYTHGGFDEEDQRRLAEVFRALDRRGCLVMLSNSETPFIRELYAGYDIRVVYSRAKINSISDKRGPTPELVIRNYRD